MNKMSCPCCCKDHVVTCPTCASESRKKKRNNDLNNLVKIWKMQPQCRDGYEVTETKCARCSQKCFLCFKSAPDRDAPMVCPLDKPKLCSRKGTATGGRCYCVKWDDSKKRKTCKRRTKKPKCKCKVCDDAVEVLSANDADNESEVVDCENERAKTCPMKEITHDVSYASRAGRGDDHSKMTDVKEEIEENNDSGEDGEIEDEISSDFDFKDIMDKYKDAKVDGVPRKVLEQFFKTFTEVMKRYGNEDASQKDEQEAEKKIKHKHRRRKCKRGKHTCSHCED